MRVLSCRACHVLLLKASWLKTSLSTIGKVHINLHMFLSEPGPRKKKIHTAFFVFVDRNNVRSSKKTASDYDKCTERGGKGDVGKM